MASGSSLSSSKLKSGQQNCKKQPSITADLVIEDDIDTELSVAALGGVRWQHQQQHSREASSKSKGRPAAEVSSSRGSIRSSNVSVATFGNRVSNRTETELDTVQFPPVRRNHAGSSSLQFKPTVPPSSLAKSSTPELPPLASDVAIAGARDANATAATASAADRPVNEASAALKQPPAKLSLDRPWWKSVGRQQQQLLLESLPPPPAPPPQPTSKPPTPPTPIEAPLESVVSDAVDLVGPSTTDAAAAKLWTRQPITEKQIEALRVALFGNGDSRFSPDWASQGFHFGFDLIPYLLTSAKQEPRSALCVVQAELLRQLLFSDAAAASAASSGSSNLEPIVRLKRLASPAQRSAALARAFHCIVARCGDAVKIVLPNSRGLSYIDNFSYAKDGISEKLDVYTCLPGCKVEQFLLENARCFVSQRTPSLALLIYSCLLTLGVDMSGYQPPDGSPWPLIGPDNLANQSLLSLLLCGSPVALVCNHYSDEVAANGSLIRVAGVPNRCDVGLLSSREFVSRRSAQPFQIGSFLKSPRCPIWLLELHQAGQQPQQQQQHMVAFACEAKLVSDWRAERLFELLLLAPDLRSRGPAKAVVDCRGNFSDNNSSSSSASSSAASLTEPDPSASTSAVPNADSPDGIEIAASDTSPVEMCLRSKWPGAEIQLL